jgi:iron complex outermembrane receptor protein
VPIWRTKLKTLNLITASVLLSSVSHVYAEQISLDPVLVTAKKTNNKDTSATYASEIYDAKDITNSGAATLYDFLNQNTSINVMPAFGNQYSQKIDMRGYGLNDGYQNIAVTINGRRLNNIDQSAPLLGAIPLKNIERIEITKGTGSVIYGDNATAGSIQIYTKKTVSHSVGLAFGNEGQQAGSFSTGYNHDFFTIRANGSHDELDGFKDEDLNGFTNESSNSTTNVELDVFPSDKITLSAARAHATIDTRYTGPMSLAEYHDEPEQNSGNVYTRQTYHTDTYSLGASFELTDQWTVELNHSNEDKTSHFVTWSSVSEYDYNSDEALLKYESDVLNFISGIQRFDGERAAFGNVTTKENMGYFVHGDYTWNRFTFSLGGRVEKVDYEYSALGTHLQDDHDLNAYDIGVNQRINDALSWFANYNYAFQAPDIDRFFNFGGTFNSFIDPARVKTLNVGFNYVTENDKTKVTFFRADLNDEIFYNAPTFTNTNIDKSHKYGVELQNRHRFNKQWLTTFNYVYTRAIIDRENEGAGSYDGHTLPGVPKHNVTLAVHYQPTESSTFVLSQSYRSNAYALNDFSNTLAQKNPRYQSTDLSYRYQFEHLTLTANIQNLLDKENGILVSTDAIYPVNFARSYNVGLKYQF